MLREPLRPPHATPPPPAPRCRVAEARPRRPRRPRPDAAGRPRQPLRLLPPLAFPPGAVDELSTTRSDRSPLVPPKTIEAPGLATALEQVSAQRMLASVTGLASDGYAGRRVGTPGGQTAADLARRAAARAGRRRATRSVSVSSVRERLYRTPVLQWSTSEETRRLEHRREFVEHLASAELPDPRSAPLADAGAADLGGRWVRWPGPVNGRRPADGPRQRARWVC